MAEDVSKTKPSSPPTATRGADPEALADAGVSAASVFFPNLGILFEKRLPRERSITLETRLQESFQMGLASAPETDVLIGALSRRMPEQLGHVDLPGQVSEHLWLSIAVEKVLREGADTRDSQTRDLESIERWLGAALEVARETQGHLAELSRRVTLINDHIDGCVNANADTEAQ